MTQPSYGFRPVTDADHDFLFHLYAGTRAQEMALVPWDASEKEAFLRMQFDAQDADYRRNYPDASFLIILVDDKLAGRLYLQRGDDEIRVIDIALLPSFRGSGIGGKVMQELLDEATQAGRPVRLHVYNTNRARRLYERLGFEALSDTGIHTLMERRPPGGTAAE